MPLRRRRAELLDRLDYRRRELSFDRLKTGRENAPASTPGPISRNLNFDLAFGSA